MLARHVCRGARTVAVREKMPLRAKTASCF